MADWAADLEETHLHAPPGTFWNYSNPGFSLAGLVAERAANLPYRELMASQIFAPAGMGATTFDPAEVMASDNYSWGHHPDPDGQVMVYAPDERFVVSILGNTTYDLRDAAYCIVDAVLEPETSNPPDYSTEPSTWATYEGSYEFMDNSGDFFQADVELVGDRLFAVFPNPIDPASPTRKELTQLYLDTFSMEPFIDGERAFELTFINRVTIGAQRMWLRNQWFVGLRIPPPRRSDGRLTP